MGKPGRPRKAKGRCQHCGNELSRGTKFCSQDCYRGSTKSGTAVRRADLAASIDLDRVSELARNGNSLETIAAECGFSKTQFTRYRQEYPELEQAFQRGRAGLEDELVGLLLKKARQGQTVPILFALKSMFGYREGEPRRGEASAQVAVQINLPAPLTAEEYRRQRDAVLVEAVGVSDDGD